MLPCGPPRPLLRLPRTGSATFPDLLPRPFRRERLAAALLYALVLSLLYFPVVFLGRTLVPSLYYPYGVTDRNLEETGWTGETRLDLDLGTPAYYEFPINRLVGQMYRQGQLPLWNPYQAAGTPLAAQYSTRAFFPYQVLEDISPPWSWDYFILGRLWIAGFFTYLFLRALKLSPPSAFLGGVFYMLSGSLVWFINLEQMANGAMMAPILMLSLERLAQKRRGAGVFAAVGFALVLLAGQPEVALYILALGGSFFLFRAASLRTFRIFPLALAFLLGLGLASPQLLPFLELVPNSFNAHPPGGTMGVQGAAPLPWAIALLVPTYFSGPSFYRTMPHNGVWDFLGGYTGVLLVFLATLGLYSRHRSWGLSLFFWLFGVLVLLKNFGFSPAQKVGYLPIFDQAWSDRWSGPAWAFALAVAGARGLEALRERRRARLAVAAASAFLLLAFLAL